MPAGRTSLALTQQQRLQQTLAPLQVQYVRMLEMNVPELEEEVRRTLDENPALVVADTHADGAEHLQAESSEELQRADYRDEDEIPPAMQAQRGDSRTGVAEILARADGETLMQALMRQLDEQGIDAADRKLAEVIAGNIDSNGYLTRTPAELVADAAMQEGLVVDMTQVNRVLNRIRSLDPAGVGAADLRECMLLQLKRLPDTPVNRLTTEMVTHYYDLLSRMQFDKLRSAMQLAPGQVEDMMAALRALNPKPGAAYADSETPQQIAPDFVVERDDDTGRFVVSMPNHIPALEVERSFDISDTSNVTESRLQREALLFVRSRRDEARNFIKVLDMRRRTMMRVMEAIVRLQPDFFSVGDPGLLRPMVLRDIAAVTGDDLSVISRATAGKYVATAGGIFPLKYFFNSKPTEDSDTSSHEIEAALREIVESENKTTPLSDEALTDALHARGYNIARRTVTKYRERAGIPSGRLRRKV